MQNNSLSCFFVVFSRLCALDESMFPSGWYFFCFSRAYKNVYKVRSAREHCIFCSRVLLDSGNIRPRVSRSGHWSGERKPLLFSFFTFSSPQTLRGSSCSTVESRVTCPIRFCNYAITWFSLACHNQECVRWPWNSTFVPPPSPTFRTFCCFSTSPYLNFTKQYPIEVNWMEFHSVFQSRTILTAKIFE